MEADKPAINSIDEYIMQFRPEIQDMLRTMRKVIKEAAPEAEEKISYSMPAFSLYGNLVYFAAAKNHIGFYPTPGGIAAFKKELSQYRGAKGSVQFPINQPLPCDLISRIVKFRVDENIKSNEAGSKKKVK